MSVSSLKMITKNVYLKLLGTQPSVRNEFMKRGGWNLIFSWTTDAIAQKNYTLAKDILALLRDTHVPISSLKSDTFILLIKQLWKACKDNEVESQCKVLLDQLRKSAKGQDKGLILVTQAIEEEASLSAGEVAMAPSADVGGGAGGDGQMSLVMECKKEKRTVVTPKDNHGALDVVQKKGSPPPLVPEFQVVTPVNKVASPILLPSSYSPSPPKKMKPSASSSGSSRRSKAADVAACIQDKKEKRRVKRLLKRKEKAAAKRRAKEADKQNEKDKETLRKISWTPPPTASSSSAAVEGKIPKKVSPNSDSNFAGVTKPLKLAKRLKEEKLKKKKGVAKIEKLAREEEQVVLVALGQQPSQVPAIEKEFRRYAAAPVGGQGQRAKKALKSCISLQNSDNLPEKSDVWKTPAEQLDGDSTTESEGGGNGAGRDGSNKKSRKDDHRGKGAGGNKSKRDLKRIDKNGKPRRRKRCEPICRFLKKGICSKGDRCDYLSAVGSPSTPANQCKKLFRPS